jgi:hypothetical protein
MNQLMEESVLFREKVSMEISMNILAIERVIKRFAN